MSSRKDIIRPQKTAVDLSFLAKVFFFFRFLRKHEMDYSCAIFWWVILHAHGTEAENSTA